MPEYTKRKMARHIYDLFTERPETVRATRWGYGVGFLFFLWMFTGKKHILDRWEGMVFVVFYTGYILPLFVQM